MRPCLLKAGALLVQKIKADMAFEVTCSGGGCNFRVRIWALKAFELLVFLAW